MTVAAVVGGQFGSEGKGLIVGEIAGEYDHHVRVGAANAGHTLYVNGVKRVMQQLPCAAYANPNAELYVGPGALISPEILLTELQGLASFRKLMGMEPPMINVDARAHVIQQCHIDREQESDLAERIGSTSTIAKEGIGAAQAARVERMANVVTAEEWLTRNPDARMLLRDVPTALYGEDVLMEGTQGTSLSLTTGRHPYITSRNTTAAGLCADCGVAPMLLDRVIMVCRTYPIRVAGSSGPFWAESEEIRWSDIGVEEDRERTTVTKKIRRVATFSMEQIIEGVILNGATEIALTFCDYLDPSIAGESGVWGEDLGEYEAVEELVLGIEQYTGVAVTMLGTGPDSVVHRDSAKER